MKCNGAFQKLPLWALTIFRARTQRVINLFNLLKAVITETYFAKHISPRKRIEKYDFKHHYLVLLKSLRDRSQVDHLAKQMFPVIANTNTNTKMPIKECTANCYVTVNQKSLPTSG